MIKLKHGTKLSIFTVLSTIAVGIVLLTTTASPALAVGNNCCTGQNCDNYGGNWTAGYNACASHSCGACQNSSCAGNNSPECSGQPAKPAPAKTPVPTTPAPASGQCAAGQYKCSCGCVDRNQLVNSCQASCPQICSNSCTGKAYVPVAPAAPPAVPGNNIPVPTHNECNLGACVGGFRCEMQGNGYTAITKTACKPGCTSDCTPGACVGGYLCKAAAGSKCNVVDKTTKCSVVKPVAPAVPVIKPVTCSNPCQLGVCTKGVQCAYDASTGCNKLSTIKCHVDTVTKKVCNADCAVGTCVNDHICKLDEGCGNPIGPVCKLPVPTAKPAPGNSAPIIVTPVTQPGGNVNNPYVGHCTDQGDGCPNEGATKKSTLQNSNIVQSTCKRVVSHGCSYLTWVVQSVAPAQNNPSAPQVQQPTPARLVDQNKNNCTGSGRTCESANDCTGGDHGTVLGAVSCGSSDLKCCLLPASQPAPVVKPTANTADYCTSPGLQRSCASSCSNGDKTVSSVSCGAKGGVCCQHVTNQNTPRTPINVQPTPNTNNPSAPQVSLVATRSLGQCLDKYDICDTGSGLVRTPDTKCLKQSGASCQLSNKVTKDNLADTIHTTTVHIDSASQASTKAAALAALTNRSGQPSVVPDNADPTAVENGFGTAIDEAKDQFAQMEALAQGTTSPFCTVLNGAFSGLAPSNVDCSLEQARQKLENLANQYNTDGNIKPYYCNGVLGVLNSGRPECQSAAN